MTQTEIDSEYNMTVKDVAELVPFTPKYITNQAKSGKLAHRRWGEGSRAPYLFNRQEVLAWKEKMLINPDKTKTSSRGGESGMSVRKGRAETLKSRSKQLIRQSLANANQKS